MKGQHSSTWIRALRGLCLGRRSRVLGTCLSTFPPCTPRAPLCRTYWACPVFHLTQRPVREMTLCSFRKHPLAGRTHTRLTSTSHRDHTDSSCSPEAVAWTYQVHGTCMWDANISQFKINKQTTNPTPFKTGLTLHWSTACLLLLIWPCVSMAEGQKWAKSETEVSGGKIVVVWSPTDSALNGLSRDRWSFLLSPPRLLECCFKAPLFGLGSTWRSVPAGPEGGGGRREHRKAEGKNLTQN